MIQAVLFDLGGVVFSSPIVSLSQWEKKLSLPTHFFAKVILKDQKNGAFSRLETGQLSTEQFCELFAKECNQALQQLNLKVKIDGREFIKVLSKAMVVRPEVLYAITQIKNKGLKTAAITNNWAPLKNDQTTEGKEQILTNQYFDVIVESWRVGLRKPDPRIFTLALEKLHVPATNCVFLDDIGQNLKPAKDLGMHTIKVDLFDYMQSIQLLEKLLGFPIIKQSNL